MAMSWDHNLAKVTSIYTTKHENRPSKFDALKSDSAHWARFHFLGAFLVNHHRVSEGHRVLGTPVIRRRDLLVACTRYSAPETAAELSTEFYLNQRKRAYEKAPNGKVALHGPAIPRLGDEGERLLRRRRIKGPHRCFNCVLVTKVETSVRREGSVRIV